MFLTRLLKSTVTLLLCGLFLFSLSPVFAAQVKNLRHQAPSSLRLFGLLPAATAGLAPQAGLQEIDRSLDVKKQLHVRLQETYAGYPVWGAVVLVHLPQVEQKSLSQSWTGLLASPQASLNGFIYHNLAADLQTAPAYIFGAARAEQAVAQAATLYQQKAGRGQTLKNKEVHLLVYVDEQQKAHWAYHIQLQYSPLHGLPALPNYLLDAASFEVYRAWNNLQTREPLSTASAGGFGGNLKMGKLVYDGLAGDYAALTIKRDDQTRSCYLENAEVVVKDVRHDNGIEKFICGAQDSQHNNLFWDGSLDAVNGGYSPANDALFVGKVIKDLYQQWYGIPVLTKRGKPMKLVMRVHEDMDNAYWFNGQMTFGDGISMFYPLVSIGVGAHEVSHGFTEQHSNLVYEGQSGGLNESFSDMAAQAAEFFATGSNHWQIGPEIVKADRPLRYMDHPSLDCVGIEPDDQCSIENARDYYPELGVHFSSGVFNRAFYLLATAPNWSVRKAFDVMVQANSHYWTPTANFQEAACGVMSAVKDYGYPKTAAIIAFRKVGIDVMRC